MRILVTNDDGINAPGLEIAEAIAAELAGPDGQVWVVAPLNERSGVAHCLSYTTPARLEQKGPRRMAVDGYPADCVLVGLYDFMDAQPDIILSGVNRGNNSAENALYSGTLGAALEGALQGIPSFALSQYYGPGNRDLDNSFEASAVHGANVVRKLLDAPVENTSSYNIFYNINFPPVSAANVLGTKVVPQGQRDGIKFSAEPMTAPNMRRFVWIKGGRQDVGSAPGTDAAVNLEGYTAVTPMRADLTAYDTITSLSGIFDE